MAAANEKQVASEIRALATILTDPDITKDKIGERVLALKGDELPKVVIRARTVMGFAKHLVDYGETEMRIRAQSDSPDAVVKTGGQWVDKGTGVVHTFEGELGDWTVADPVGLINALERSTRTDGSRYVDDDEIKRAVVATYKPNHNVLNEIAKRSPELAGTINSFREKKRGAAHLKEAKV